MSEMTVEPSGDSSMNAADLGPAGDNQADGEKPGLFEADPEGSSAGAELGATDTPQRHLVASPTGLEPEGPISNYAELNDFR